MSIHEKAVNSLKDWFLTSSRDLPWRGNPSPYAVWVSEVMLQQTQVAVVIPYFMRWMTLFPSVKALADAPLERVLKEWEGLGYYSRARNLHEGARYVMEHYQGQIPDTAEALKKIKGLGDYTVGALLSFAFHQKAAAVDGNVLRVLARFFGVVDDIGKSSTRKELARMAEALLPDQEPWVVSEALIELGAVVCSRKPKCRECPLVGECRAYATGQQEKLPVRAERPATQFLCRLVAVVQYGDALLVKKVEEGKIMAGLYEFPYIDATSLVGKKVDRRDFLEKHLREQLGMAPLWKQQLVDVRHSFTQYRALLLPHLYSIEKHAAIPGFEWLPLNLLQQRAFSSGHKRIFNQALSFFCGASGSLRGA